MNTLKGSLLAGVAMVAMSGTANAAYMEWTDIIDPPSDIYVTAPNYVPLNHDIRDVTSGSFNSLTDTITSASLTIWLRDDDFLGDLGELIGFDKESVQFNFDGGQWTPASEVDSIFFSSDIFTFAPSLQTTGLLALNVKAKSGDFYFEKSKLVAKGTRVSVPEPATLALFSLGLLGLGFGMRRKA